MKFVRSILFALILLPLVAGAQAPTSQRGIGPFTLQARNGSAEVRLVRLDRDMLWVDQQTRDGRYVEVGVPRANIISITVPPIAVLEAARRASTTQQIAQVEQPLRRVVDTLRVYRDLPGIPFYDAELILGRMLMTQGRDTESLNALSDVVANSKDPAFQQEANLRKGLILARQGRNEEALTILENISFPEDDPILTDDLYFARANAKAAVGRHRDALMDFFYPVVFAPTINRAEPRALFAALPSLVAIDDWISVARTLDVLHAEFGEEPETEKADEWARQYQKQLGLEQSFQVPGS
ncbi:MAG: hypothetical protein M9963_10325 [Kiritimatiellae bacterium]|nr:hypothetical protein [Kiritimatiellia bacterium]